MVSAGPLIGRHVTAVHEGLLDAVPRQGYMVPEIPCHTVCDTFEVRLILEAAIAELATLRADDSEIEELARLAAQPLPDRKSKDDFAELFSTNAAFHLRLAAMTRNRELIELLKRNLERAERLSYLEWRSSRFHEQELRTQHIRIVEAIRSRNPQAAREALLSDIVEGQRNTMKFGKEVLGLRIGISDGARARMNRKRIWVHPADPEPFERQNLFIGPSRPLTIAFSAQRGLRCEVVIS